MSSGRGQTALCLHELAHRAGGGMPGHRGEDLDERGRPSQYLQCLSIRLGLRDPRGVGRQHGASTEYWGVMSTGWVDVHRVDFFCNDGNPRIPRSFVRVHHRGGVATPQGTTVFLSRGVATPQGSTAPSSWGVATPLGRATIMFRGVATPLGTTTNTIARPMLHRSYPLGACLHRSRAGHHAAGPRSWEGLATPSAPPAMHQAPHRLPTAYLWAVTHREHNRLHHATHGNGADGGTEGPRLLTLNASAFMLPRGFDARAKDDSSLTAACKNKKGLIESAISLYQPMIVCLQELKGDADDIGRIRTWLKVLGFESAARAGEPAARGEAAFHRHGGVATGWRAREFEQVAGASDLLSHMAALLVGVKCEAAKHSGRAMITEPEGDDAADPQLTPYVGRRAMAVHLRRKRGPLANQVLVVGNVYMPAGASHRLKALLLQRIANYLRNVALQGLPFVCAGDWNCTFGVDWREGSMTNSCADDKLCSLFGPQGDAGRAVSLGLRHDEGQYSFHSNQGHHRTIDHVMVDHRHGRQWKRDSNRAGIFLGSLGEHHDDQAAFDHRAMLLTRDEGEAERLGQRRKPATRISRDSAAGHAFAEGVLSFDVAAGAEVDDELGRLENHVAMVAEDCKRSAMPADRVPRHDPPDTAETRVKYWRRMVHSIELRFDNAQFFAEGGTKGLYSCGVMRRERDNFLKNLTARPPWRRLRAVAHHQALRAFNRAHADFQYEEGKRRAMVAVGAQEPANGEDLARQLHRRQRAIKQLSRGGGASITALRDSQGVTREDAQGCHEVAHEYGVSQNGPSSHDSQAFDAYLRFFVPKGELLTLPNGAPWTIRDAMPFDVFARSVQRAGSNKAPSLSPFLVDHLKALGEGHPTCSTYYNLLVRCMETGVYPASYFEIIACLIPKTYGNCLDISSLRDIWLTAHGAKLAERMLLDSSLVPLSRAIRLEASGGCKGRGCTEQAFSLHASVEQAVALKRDMYVLYVDLSKCFMSFSREGGFQYLDWLGLPPEARIALAGLCQCDKHGCIRGRYETAYGSTEAFEIARGFIQGALASPEKCKAMMNTLAELVNLKVTGSQWWSPDGMASYLTQLIFIDDAANTTGSFDMIERVARFWDIWCVITGCEMNIAKFKKTVFCGLEWSVDSRGEALAADTQRKLFIKGAKAGDPPREVPRMSIMDFYKYVGFWSRLGGDCLAKLLGFVGGKIKAANATAVPFKSSRRLVIDTANSTTLGNCYFYGAVLGSSVEKIDATLGVAVRAVLQSGSQTGHRLDRSTSRLQIHAPRSARPANPNDPPTVLAQATAGESAFATGYGLEHPYPPLVAASLSTFWNALASPAPTPARAAAHSAYGRIMYELGCRADPSSFDYSNQLLALDHDSCVERPIRIMAEMRNDRCGFEQHFGTDSCLHACHWPGYPSNWLGLWHGAVWHRLKPHLPLAGSRIIQRLGVAEVANGCPPEGGRFLTWTEFATATPEALRHGAAAQRQYRALMTALKAAGVPPVPGRTAVPAAIAMSGMERGVATTSGSRARIVHEQAQASGDGGLALLQALDDRTGEEVSSDFDAVCTALKGSAEVHPAVRADLVGPDQLSVDGASLRTVYSYNRKLPPGQRLWKSYSTGGKHGHLERPADEAAAWKAESLSKFKIGRLGWLMGDKNDPKAPRAARFWWACEEKMRAAKREPCAEECRFAYGQLIEIESRYPVTHFIATDGSRKPRTESEPAKVGRVAIVHDGVDMSVYGGSLEAEEDGFERHSFEAEVAGFSDALSSAPKGSVIVVVTDCLSGGLAGGRWRFRSASEKSGRYRDEALADIERLESDHLAVLYVWVHSHIGITPNEVADAECDTAMDRSGREVLRMPSRHQLAKLPDVKRSVGGHAYQHALAVTTAYLREGTKHTLLSQESTWTFFRDSPSMRGRMLRQTDHDELREAQADRAGLLHDTNHRSKAPQATDCTPEEACVRRMNRPRKGTYEAFKRLSQCPCCGDRTAPARGGGLHVDGVWAVGAEQQTLAHVLFECAGPVSHGHGGEVVRGRTAAADWLEGRDGRELDNQDARLALRALQGEWRGLSVDGKRMALRFVLGHPTTPLSDCSKDRKLALALARHFYRNIADVLRASRAASCEAQRSPPTLRLLWRIRPRSEWMAKRGLRDVWEGWRSTVSCFGAWRLRVAQRGPANSNLRLRSPRGRSDSPLFSASGLVSSAAAWAMQAAFAEWGAVYAEGSYHGCGRTEERREALLGGCIAARGKALASLVRLRHAGQAVWAHPTKKRASTAADSARQTKRASVEAVRRSERAGTQMVKDWERLNLKDSRKFWREKVAVVAASSAAGSELEQRQAKAQRRHAQECQEAADLDLAGGRARNLASLGSHGISVPQLLYLARRLLCAQSFTSEALDSLGEVMFGRGDAEIAAFVVRREWAAELALTDPGIASQAWCRQAMHISRGWALEAREVAADSLREGALAGSSGGEAWFEPAAHESPPPAPHAVRFELLQQLAIWMRETTPLGAEEVEVCRAHLEDSADATDDALAN